jgi:hypothetical protein
MKAMLARQAVERNDLNMWLKKQIDDVNVLLERVPVSVLAASMPELESGVIANMR